MNERFAPIYSRYCYYEQLIASIRRITEEWIDYNERYKREVLFQGDHTTNVDIYKQLKYNQGFH